jgi:hypothetical protein
MNKDSEMKNNFVLSMRQIASWQIDAPDIVHELAPIQARVPSLQRGAVWEPQQIEMLWDSIFRGFPIGAIVVSEPIEEQLDRKNTTQVKNDDILDKRKTTHHILDGQQRCNAITWGFVDPFQKNMRDDIILWLDLKPGELLNNTTRKYLFRITTKAHPWGFGHDDEAKILKVDQRNSFVQRLKEQYEKYKGNNVLPSFFTDEAQRNPQVETRPAPKFAFPAEARCPVPVYLLLRHFSDGKLNLNKLAQEPWIKFIEVWSGISIKDEEYTEIENGLNMAEQARLIALSVPNGLESIENVEQIFQRLNRQGTPLDNEELVYSMMKAYWPAIEDVISKIENPPITEARLVNLGIRIALTENGSEKLAPELTVERIRKIFSGVGDKTKKDDEDRETIENYFQTKGELSKALKWINDYLLYKDTCTYGLPAYLRSSIAWSSREVFAWLMLLAKRDDYSMPAINPKKIIGLALSIHWFGLDKEKAVNKLICNTDLSNVKVADINEGSEKKLVLVPLNVPELNAALQLDENSGDVQLSKWISFWQGVVVCKADGKPRSEEDAIMVKEEYGLFIEKLRNQNEFLVYEQREYIEKVFEGFDPSNKLMWKGHNRPWDYDHILPSNKLNGQGRSLKKYTAVCQVWQQSIGNLIAVDFTFNRSAQDKKTASEKYVSHEYIKDGFFDIELDDTEDIDKARKFVLAAKSRLIRTYREWFDGLNIDQGKMP